MILSFQLGHLFRVWEGKKGKDEDDIAGVCIFKMHFQIVNVSSKK